MDLQLKDKVALITGSTKGIGRAIAATLSTTQVPHRKLRREPWKFGKPQNIFATKRGPLKTCLLYTSPSPRDS